jgi:hypothetical protein
VSRDNRNDPTNAAVICLDGCGLQFLTDAQELEGLNRPDDPWRCPKCGGRADWDDDCRATNPPEDSTTGDR